MKQVATFQIQDIFKITGRGIVFSGIVLTGEFMIGDLVKFDFKGQILERKIKGLDAGMRIKEGYPKVAIMIECLNQKEIDDLRNWNSNLTIGEIYSK